MAGYWVVELALSMVAMTVLTLGAWKAVLLADLKEFWMVDVTVAE
jgi:hypothetical protein